MADRSLHECNVLIAEDEFYAADDLRRELIRMGATVIGPAPTLERVTDLIEDAKRIDGAILDINLGGEMIFSAADILIDRGVAFMFATGYDMSVVPWRFQHIARCEKPIAPGKLANVLTALISTSRPHRE